MKLSEIKNELKKMLMQFSVVKTDKAILQYDAEELAVGVKVTTETEESEIIIPEDGSYVMEDGRTLVVENGEIKEIVETSEVEPIEETTETEEVTEPEMVEETTEVEPIEEATETEEVTEEVTEVEPIEEATEPEEVTEGEPIEEVPSLEAKIAELEGKVAELEGLIAKLTEGAEEMHSAIEKMSMAKPITEEFENVKSPKKTGDAKLDRFLERYGK